MLTIVNLVRQPSVGTLTNVVTGVHWRLELEVGGMEHSYESFMHIDPPNPDDHIDYNILTQENVLEWISERFVEEILLHLDEINETVANSLVTRHELHGLPWVYQAPPMTAEDG